ncbi:hypothetical protein AGMMS49592_0380 [Endomicrobiia bacterium]|nr:hypothetical protein AGMMS49592_0380 [Endomicrobiia bacterium]
MENVQTGMVVQKDVGLENVVNRMNTEAANQLDNLNRQNEVFSDVSKSPQIGSTTSNVTNEQLAEMFENPQALTKEEAAKVPVLQYPKSWKEEDIKTFELVPQEHREKMYKFISKEIGGNIAKYKARALDDVLEPYDNLLLEKGIPRKDFVNEALQVFTGIARNPLDAVANILVDSNKTIDDLIAYITQEKEQTENMTQEANEIMTLKQEVNEMRRYLEKKQKDDLINNYEQRLREFELQTDENGNLLHPYMKSDEVKEQMVKLAPIYSSLQEIYDAAIKLTPGVSNKMQLNANNGYAQNAIMRSKIDNSPVVTNEDLGDLSEVPSEEVFNRLVRSGIIKLKKGD